MFRKPTASSHPDRPTASVDDTVNRPVLKNLTVAPRWWFLGFAVGFVLLMVWLYTVVTLIIRGTGIWGNNIPVAWAFPIINFVWWIGIGHAGTLISAILLLFRQDWRTSINRFAEAMTLFAVVCAGLGPILHLGRPWLFYWLFPYPNTYGLWPQFRSPLDWDVFAISTYATVSALFWFIGLVPDLASMRDKATHPVSTHLLRYAWRSAGAVRHETLAALSAGVSAPGSPIDAAGLIRSLDDRHGLRRRAAAGGGITPSRRPTSLLGPFTPVSRWCLILGIPLRRAFGLEGLDHQKTPRQLRQGHVRDRNDRFVRLHYRTVYRLVLGRRIRALYGL